MKLISKVFQSAYVGLSHRFRAPPVVRTLSTYSFFPGANDKGNSDNFESNDDFERRIFGGENENDPGSIFRSLDKVEKSHHGSGFSFEGFDGLDKSFNTLSDGMEGKLKDAAISFSSDDDDDEDYYSFRPDIDIQPGMVLDTKDLDLRKPAAPGPPRRVEFETTTKEVLQNADFRNVRFLANFITDAGIIIKRSKTGISAKAQRKVAREIKTARAFGLLPFTTMGTKAFVYGKTMENLDKDFEFETSQGSEFVDIDRS